MSYVDNFFSCVAILCGAVPASARCENLIGVMVLNVRISFFENARPHRVARTRSCSLSPAFFVLNFTRTRFFSKNLCCCCYFGHCCRGF
jgi:hypothetical protein